MKKLQAPFPYFGGKSQISDLIWYSLGNVRTYIEPFFGSGAVLLSRPNYDQTQHIEIVCDKDGFVANVWRSLQYSPDEVAKWCDWPINHCCLMARKVRMNKNKDTLLKNLSIDDKWHDPVIAGYWIWAASCWIGSGLNCPNQIPNIGHTGEGVHKLNKRPDITGNQIPNIGNTGMGVHKLSQIPDISKIGKGVQEPYNNNIYTWFRKLSERLRYVKVVCGDWSRVCGGNWQAKTSSCGIFFDPPYGEKAGRDNRIYAEESLTVADDVRKWCIKRGDDPNMRIILAGYEGEHEELLKFGWSVKKWSAGKGYSSLKENEDDKKANRHKERLWLSPRCIGKQNSFHIFDY